MGLEELHPIDGVEGYFVTPEGQVWSFKRREPKVLKPCPNPGGYLNVCMVHLSGKQKTRYIHAMVAAAFLPPKPTPESELRHLNGDQTDNRAVNLTWGTAKENAEDRERHGKTARGDRSGSRLHPEKLRRGENHPLRMNPERAARGEQNGSARFSESDVIEMRRLRASGWTIEDLARKFDSSKSTAHSVVTGKTWAHIPLEEGLNPPRSSCPLPMSPEEKKIRARANQRLYEQIHSKKRSEWKRNWILRKKSVKGE